MVIIIIDTFGVWHFEGYFRLNKWTARRYDCSLFTFFFFIVILCATCFHTAPVFVQFDFQHGYMSTQWF